MSGYEKMLAENAKQSNGALIDAVQAFVALRQTDPELARELRLAVSSVMDTLERRNPAMTEALEAWANDFSPAETYEEVVLRYATGMDRDAR
jgi:hypothetical protein